MRCPARGDDSAAAEAATGSGGPTSSACATDSLPRLASCSDPTRVARIVADAHRSVGYLLNDLEDVAILVDALCVDGPIIGASKGFIELTGYSLEEVLGANCRMLLRGVPEVAISRSARKNIRDYCNMCQIAGLKDISETTSLQPNCRRDGSIFMNLFMLGICMVRRHPYILSVQLPLSEGLSVRLRQSEAAEAIEAARVQFKRVRAHLRANVVCDEQLDDGTPEFLRQGTASQPEFAFFTERLQDHCLLINGGFTAIRREPEELAINCLVFGDRPVKPTKEGLAFRVHVDEVVNSFTGLPVLGFTRRRPVDDPALFPCVSRCLGASVLIGACGEAFVRDKYEHFNMGFKPPPQEEVQTWTWQPGVPIPKRAPPVKVKPGDVLRCVYTYAGRLQLYVDDDLVLDFDTGRPLDPGVEHWAVADVCFSVYSLTLMPLDERDTTEEEVGELDHKTTFAREVSFENRDFVGEVSPPLSPGRLGGLRTCHEDIDHLLKEVVIKQGIKAAIATSCNFCVTVADPRGKDCPLIAVSEEFERMTGFASSEAVGVNCRFLNQGCDMHPVDLLNLRLSSKTGAPFTAVIPNRRKSGELFLNLLDLRGLTVATHPQTGEDLWFLVGIQADVTDLAEDRIPDDHLAEMHQVADRIRAAVARELSEFAFAGATSYQEHHQSTGEDTHPADAYQLLDKPRWRPGAPLGQRRRDENLARAAMLDLLPDSSPGGPAAAVGHPSLLVRAETSAADGPLVKREEARHTGEVVHPAPPAFGHSALALGGLVCLAGAVWMAATAASAQRVAVVRR